MKVKVNWNSSMKQFSVKKWIDEGWQDTQYRNKVLLLNAQFIINKERRNIGLAKGERNQHAYIVGELYNEETECINFQDCTIEVFYNPFQYEGFTDANGRLTNSASKVLLSKGRIFISKASK